MTQKQAISILLRMVSAVRYDNMKVGSAKWKKYERALKEAQRIMYNG